MARQITLDDREVIEIVNSQGAVTGSFLFNPTDLDIVQRCEKVIDYFNNLQMPDSENIDMDMVNGISDQIKSQFDYLLDSEASVTLFAHCNPLSPREDGTLYCEYVLETITRFIEKEYNVRTKKTQARISKYTRKYQK